MQANWTELVQRCSVNQDGIMTYLTRLTWSDKGVIAELELSGAKIWLDMMLPQTEAKIAIFIYAVRMHAHA